MKTAVLRFRLGPLPGASIDESRIRQPSLAVQAYLVTILVCIFDFSVFFDFSPLRDSQLFAYVEMTPWQLCCHGVIST